MNSKNHPKILNDFFKVRLGQIAEKKAKRKAQVAEAEEELRLINEQTEREIQATEQLYLAKKESARNLKSELGRQVRQKEQNKQLAYEQFLEEKTLIDDLVQKIKIEER